MTAGWLAGVARLPRWALAGAGSFALVALLGSVLLVVQSVSAACAAAAPAMAAPAMAAPAMAAASGKATYYTIGGNGGNCSYGPQASDLYVALGPSAYAAAGGCGAYYDVTGPKGTVRVKAVDQCPECAPGHLDLGIEAFKRIGNQVDGIIPITYQVVRDPALSGSVTMRVKEGSSQYWLAVLADNTGNALAKVELRSASGGWQSLNRTDYNYWLDTDGAGPGPFTFRLTDVTGRQVTVGGITLSPGTVQRTGVSMYSGAAGAAPNPTRTKAAATAAATSRAGTTSGAASPGAATASPATTSSIQGSPAATAPSGSTDATPSTDPGAASGTDGAALTAAGKGCD